MDVKMSVTIRINDIHEKAEEIRREIEKEVP